MPRRLSLIPLDKNPSAPQGQSVKALLIGLLALVLLVVALLFALRPQSSPPRFASLSFLGHTNAYGVETGRWAMFLLTNSAPIPIVWRPKSVEHHTAAGWVTNLLQTNVKSPDYLYPKNWSEEDLPNKSGMIGENACVYYVPPPITNGTGESGSNAPRHMGIFGP